MNETEGVRVTKTKGEIQYQECIDQFRTQGFERLGFVSGWAYLDDPKRLAFALARYKFVAKMLQGCNHVLEMGCGDAFCSRIVRQEVEHLTAIDFDADFVADARERGSKRWPIEVRMHDMLDGPVDGSFDGQYSLDVLEHISSSDEDRFLTNAVASLTPHGTMIIGMPSLQSQAYASAHSKIGHVNCKDQRDLKRLLQKYFHNVYAFSMNDEVVHTGYHAMAHYNLVLCCGKRW
jgi:cyclopropane fatty-acyl-phospholipid synthase-like methyltransferase